MVNFHYKHHYQVIILQFHHHPPLLQHSNQAIPQPATSATQQVDLTAILEAVHKQACEELYATDMANDNMVIIKSLENHILECGTSVCTMDCMQ